MAALLARGMACPLGGHQPAELLQLDACTAAQQPLAAALPALLQAIVTQYHRLHLESLIARHSYPRQPAASKRFAIPDWASRDGRLQSP